MNPRPPIHEVLAEEVEVQRREWNRRGPMMKRLLENKDFLEFVEIGKAQLAGHLLELRRPLQTRDEAYLQEFRKGAAFGIDTLLSTPAHIVTTATSIMQKEEDDAARRKSISNTSEPDADTESGRGRVTADSNLES